MFTRRDPADSGQPSRDDTTSRVDQSTPAMSRSTPVAAPAAQPQQSAGAEAESLIAQEDTFEGQIKTTTGVRVLGTVRGTIESERSVRIEAGALVEADISAEEVVIAGTYSGTLTCRNRVEIASTARVSGKLDTVKLYLHEGGFFDGELHMQRPEDGPPRAAAAEESRPRRSRYVDITSDTPRPADAGTSETDRREEPAS